MRPGAALPGEDGVMPDIDVETYLEAIVEAARQALGTGFAGAYAAGSLALDAFHPGRSDIDIALLCREPLAEAVKRDVIARVRHSALPCPARGLELVVYTVATALSGTAEPGFELEVNDGADMAFRQSLQPADRPAADGAFWYGLDRSILHQGGRVLAGPRHQRPSGPASPRQVAVQDRCRPPASRGRLPGRDDRAGPGRPIRWGPALGPAHAGLPGRCAAGDPHGTSSARLILGIRWDHAS